MHEFAAEAAEAYEVRTRCMRPMLVEFEAGKRKGELACKFAPGSASAPQGRSGRGMLSGDCVGLTPMEYGGAPWPQQPIPPYGAPGGLMPGGPYGAPAFYGAPGVANGAPSAHGGGGGGEMVEAEVVLTSPTL
eukprot:1351659-Prymnesium_polylepis.1